MAHRAKLPSFHLFISPHISRTRGCAVLCLNLAEHTPSIAEEKGKRASKSLDFLVNVPFWSAPHLSLSQQVRSSNGFTDFAPTWTGLFVAMCPNRRVERAENRWT